MNMNFILKLAKQLETTEFRVILKFLYIDQDLSLRSIADLLDVSHSQVYNLLNKEGIKKIKRRC